MEKQPEKQIIIYREGLLQSLLADFGTFTFLLISFGVNQKYIGSRFLSAILLIMFVFFILGKSSTRKHIFTDKKKAIEFLNSTPPIL